jgi:hypothetical protein
MIHTIFDNTKQVQNFSRTKEAQKILQDNHKGNDEQIFKVGDKVRTTNACPYQIEGIITEAYEMAGYWYYMIDGRAYRTKDLTKAGR